MKTKNTKPRKLTKIFAAVLALALLACVCFALSVSAEDTPTLKIVAKNVDFQDVYTVAFAAESSDENADIELFYYLEDPALNREATAYTAHEGSTANYANVFYTHGVSAQNIAKEIWAKAHIVGTDVYSDVVKYSVAEYVYSRLYRRINPYRYSIWICWITWIIKFSTLFIQWTYTYVDISMVN